MIARGRVKAYGEQRQDGLKRVYRREHPGIQAADPADQSAGLSTGYRIQRFRHLAQLAPQLVDFGKKAVSRCLLRIHQINSAGGNRG